MLRRRLAPAAHTFHAPGEWSLQSVLWLYLRCCLPCCRPQSEHKGGPVDVYGVVGAVCVHGVPCKDVFVDMPMPEQFSYYLLILRVLLLFARVRHAYVDFACKLKKTWRRYRINNMPGEGRVQGCRCLHKH